MLAFTEEQLYPKASGVLTIGHEEGFIYVDQHTYERLTICRFLLSDNPNVSWEPKKTQPWLKGTNQDNVKKILNILPEELSALRILYPILDFELIEEDLNISTLIGIADVALGNIDIIKYWERDEELRTTYRPSANILIEYQRGWEAFKLKCVNEDLVSYAVPYVLSMTDYVVQAKNMNTLETGIQKGGASRSDGEIKVVDNNDGTVTFTMDDIDEEPDWLNMLDSPTVDDKKEVTKESNTENANNENKITNLIKGVKL